MQSTYSHQRIVFWLTVAGFFLEFKPSEPFLTNYLIENKGLTNAQVDQDMYGLPFVGCVTNIKIYIFYIFS